jgi:diacylglycerol kinase family enzyme
MNDVLYIINPAGHGGAGFKAWESFKEIWSDPIDSEHFVFTERPGHAREIVNSNKGIEVFAAVGGDGTVGEIMSAMMDRGNPGLKLAIVPAGTGPAG